MALCTVFSQKVNQRKKKGFKKNHFGVVFNFNLSASNFIKMISSLRRC